MGVTEDKKLHSEKLWTATFTLLLLINLCSLLLGNGLHNGIAILVEESHAPATLTGIISASFSLTALVIRLFAGDLSDRQGRKKVLLAGAAFMALGSILSLFCSNLNLLIGTRILMGVGFGLSGTTVSAAAADIIPSSRLGEGMGYLGLAMALTMAVGPSISIYLAMKGQLPLFGFFSVLMVATIALIFPCKLKKPLHPSGEQGGDATGSGTTRFMLRFLEKRAFRPAFVVTLASFTLCIYMIYVSLFAVTNGIEGAGLFFIVAAATMVALRIFASKAFDRFSPNTLLVPAYALGALGILAMLVFPGMPSLIVAGLCFGYCDTVNMSVLLSESFRSVPENRHGAASATFTIGCDVGMGVGSLLWGIVIDVWGFNGVFIGGIFFMLAAIGASLVLLRRHSAEEPVP